MKFDVIIGNPPYQLSDGGNGVSAKPIYNLFVDQAKKLNPRYLTMIIPARWFSGGKGLDNFRKTMLSDYHITHLIDYQNAKDCFPNISIGERETDCKITNVINGKTNTLSRPLNQFPVFVRYNEAINIIEKVKKLNEPSIVEQISSRNPFGLATNIRGTSKKDLHTLLVYSSKEPGYISYNKIIQGHEYIKKYKIMISRVTSEHAGEPDSDGKYKVISSLKILEPEEVCTDSYIIAFSSQEKKYTKNAFNYIKTKFVRFLILQTLSSINLSRERYEFVPMQDFSKSWTDEELYAKYNLTDDEIAFIESMIKPMDLGGDD